MNSPLYAFAKGSKQKAHDDNVDIIKWSNMYYVVLATFNF